MRLVVIGCLLVASAAPAFADKWGEIDCAKAKTADEKAICSSTTLVQKDAQMSVEYGLMKGFLAMGGRGELADDQRDWLKKRSTCGAAEACLARLYDERMATLEKGLERVKEHGPF